MSLAVIKEAVNIKIVGIRMNMAIMIRKNQMNILINKEGRKYLFFFSANLYCIIFPFLNN